MINYITKPRSQYITQERCIGYESVVALDARHPEQPAPPLAYINNKRKKYKNTNKRFDT